MDIEQKTKLDKTLLQARLIFLAALTAFYLALFFFQDKLQFPLKWDEERFWQISQSFGQRLFPTWEQLKNYDSPNTPLPFLIFGWLEHISHGGIFVGRLFDFILSFILLCLIGLPRNERTQAPVLSTIGLLLCPYYLFSGLHLYTDIIATFFVVFGFYFYTHNRHLLSGLCFVLAIASRQYMLAFPVAVAGYELVVSLRNGFRIDRRWLIPILAAATILGWVWFFGGLVPPEAATPKNLPVQQASESILPARWLFPDRSFYFLACVGFYFVLPEWILFQRWKLPKSKPILKYCIIAFVLTILFLIFPPIDSKGILTKIIQFIPVSFLQIAALYILILSVCWRFAHFNLAFWVLLMNFGILMRGFAWDKYVLPVIAVLWYLKSINDLDNSPDNSSDDFEPQQHSSDSPLKGAGYASGN